LGCVEDDCCVDVVDDIADADLAISFSSCSVSSSSSTRARAPGSRATVPGPCRLEANGYSRGGSRDGASQPRLNPRAAPLRRGYPSRPSPSVPARGSPPGSGPRRG
jgi:hypothetical protein